MIMIMLMDPGSTAVVSIVASQKMIGIARSAEVSPRPRSGQTPSEGKKREKRERVQYTVLSLS